MFPTGHAANQTADLKKILHYKGNTMLGDLVFDDAALKANFMDKLVNMQDLDNCAGLYCFDGEMKQHPPIDG